MILLGLAARMLRGEGNFTQTLRVAGFAQSAHVLELLGFLPVIGPLARLIAILLTVFGVWTGTVVVNNLKGWRTILLPVIYLLATILAIVFILAVIEIVYLTFDALLLEFGLNVQ